MLNVNFIKAVDCLNLKHPVSQISKDLAVSKGTVSSYFNGNIKASESFLKKFANFYKIPLKDLMETENDRNTIISKGVPYFDVDFTASFLEVENNKATFQHPILIIHFSKAVIMWLELLVNQWLK